MTAILGQDYIVTAENYQVHKRFNMKKGDILKVVNKPEKGIIQVSDAYFDQMGKVVLVEESEFLNHCQAHEVQLRSKKSN